MSVDYYLVSPSHRKSVMIGCDGLSGVQSFPANQEVVDYVRWAIEEFITDIIFVDEHRKHEICDDDEAEHE